MRSRKEIIKETVKIQNQLSNGQKMEWFIFLRGAYIGMMWALGYNGSWKKTRQFPSPTDFRRKREFND